MRNKFNRYCAEVVGLHVCSNGLTFYPDMSDTFFSYSPYDNLNQMAEVVNKLLHNKWSGNYPNMDTVFRIGFHRAFLDFIISTMPDDMK